jgi:hypothetical protein
MRPILGSGGKAPFILQLHKTVQITLFIIRRVTVIMAAQHRSHAEWCIPENNALHNLNVSSKMHKYICFGSKGTLLHCCQWRMNML